MTNGNDILEYEEENWERLSTEYKRKHFKEYVEFKDSNELNEEDATEQFIEKNRDEFYKFVELEYSSRGGMYDD